MYGGCDPPGTDYQIAKPMTGSIYGTDHEIIREQTMKHYMFALLLPLAALTAVSGTRAEETQADAKPAPQKREFTIDKQYLNILIKRGGPAHRMRLTFPDGSISEISMCIPDASEQPGSWAVVDVAPFKGKSLTLEAVDRLPENFLHAFSIAEVEVYDEHGTNIALASRGTGVTVNSTYHGSGQELAAHRWYCPLHYDAGFKWARVGYHDDPINWHWVEKENGLLAIDPETDKAVTELVGNGVEIIMSLGFGNRLYSGPATRDVPQLWEWNYSVLYPRLSDQAAERSWCGSFPATEMEKAKYVAQVFTRDSGLGIESFFCEMYCPTYGLLDLSLLRRSFDADPIAPLQPQAAYYVTRNLATLLDGLEPATFECSFEGAPPNVESFMFTAPDGRALALWQGGRAKEHCARIPVDVRLKSACRQAVACDPVNGVQQDMLIQPVDGGMRIQGVLVGDSPLIIRLRDR